MRKYITPLNVFAAAVVALMVTMALNRDEEGWWIMGDFILLLFVLLPVLLASTIISYRVKDRKKNLLYQFAVILVYALIFLYSCFF